MKKSHILMIAAVAAFLALISVLSVMTRQTRPVASPAAASSVSGSAETAADTQEQTGDSEQKKSSKKKHKQKQQEQSETAAQSSADTGGTAQGGSSAKQEKKMRFPYTADGLEIAQLSPYSGYFIEDGTEDPVKNVAALQVTNVSGSIIEYGKITVKAGGKTLHFEVSLLPPDATAMVMESDRKKCSDGTACYYRGSQLAYLDALDMKQDQVSVTTDGTGQITVQNLTDAAIPQLRLFYKNRLETGEYIGGIAYTAKLDDLAAGESRTVQPSHFDAQYGVVMMVRTYE